MSEFEYDEDRVEEVWERAGATLRGAIRYHEESARELHEQAKQSEKWAREIKQAVRKGEWWKLGHMFDRDDIELMSNIEPSDRASILEG